LERQPRFRHRTSSTRTRLTLRVKLFVEAGISPRLGSSLLDSGWGTISHAHRALKTVAISLHLWAEYPVRRVFMTRCRRSRSCAGKVFKSLTQLSVMVLNSLHYNNFPRSLAFTLA